MSPWLLVTVSRLPPNSGPSPQPPTLGVRPWASVPLGGPTGLPSPPRHHPEPPSTHRDLTFYQRGTKSRRPSTGCNERLRLPSRSSPGCRGHTCFLHMRAGWHSSRPSQGSLKRGCFAPPLRFAERVLPRRGSQSSAFRDFHICNLWKRPRASGRGPWSLERAGHEEGSAPGAWVAAVAAVAAHLPPPSPRPPCARLGSPVSCSEPPVIAPASGTAEPQAPVGACPLRGVGLPCVTSQKVCSGGSPFRFLCPELPLTSSRPR